MKRKILFYGNCQLGVIARYFRLNLSDQFDVQLCTDCGLELFWNEPGLFAVWSPVNRKVQESYTACVHSKIKESDIFVFQPHDGGRWLRDELKTEYLYSSVAEGQKICFPDTRFFAHLSDRIALDPFINYVKTKVESPEEIIAYLKTSDDSELTNILKNEYPFQTSYQPYRRENRHRYEENLKIYDNVIDMCEYIERMYKTKLVALTHNHPAECFYVEAIEKICKMLGVDNLKRPIENLEFPGKGIVVLDPRQFSFFNHVFPDIDYGDFKGRDLTINDVASM